jgi:hypothetical protein
VALVPITNHRTGRFTMRKFIIAVAALSFSASSFASTASANHGHHGGQPWPQSEMRKYERP